MSYTNVLGVKLNEGVEELCEYRNSHGFGPPVWEVLIEHYVGGSRWDDEAHKKLEESELTALDRMMYQLTWDGAYIKRQDFARAAQDIEKFFKIHPYSSEYVNHWPEIAKMLREWNTAIDDREELGTTYDAIGFYGSSCSGDCVWFGERHCDCDCKNCGNGETTIHWDKVFDVYEDEEE